MIDKRKKKLNSVLRIIFFCGKYNVHGRVIFRINLIMTNHQSRYAIILNVLMIKKIKKVILMNEAE